MASFRKYKGAHLKPRGGARRRGARQNGNNGCGPGMTMNGAGYCVPNGGMRRRGAKAHTPGHNGNGSCPAGMHMMPNGTCMEGAYHGAVAGQNGGYRRKPARRRPTARRSRPVGRRAPRRRR